ncbi:hypothetical protein E0485_16540 [Paenibacillus albiflavus]|uniref:Glycosyl hydrolase family 8 n=1 Tax=Paenibacillus albiflavus TaxID=2545760 RepID=A0A4R4E7H8_9BACL|nr:glycosyl hydrolase family 8 [Paenibacillus albiflavus]TCZ75704.1 hypothetical protein E0485_16540 [Paenibacillus albiflavus]
MRKSVLFCISLILLSCICLVVYQFTTRPNKLTTSPAPNSTPIPSTQQPHFEDDNTSFRTERTRLHQFIVDKLSGNFGVYTNLIDTGQSDEVATGHEILSESAGLLMRYYALTEQKEAFEREWHKAKQNFDLKTGFSYRFSPKQNKKYTLNAAVDDLRIVRALYEAGAQFHDEQYSQEAASYATRFFQYNVKEHRLYDFYDETYQMTNSFITLCYVNFSVLEQLPDPNGQVQALQSNMLQIVQNGYLSDQFPFYQTRYSYEQKAYQSDQINTVESLLTILSLAEIKQQKPESIQYIKKHVKSGTLYGRYSQEGKQTTDIQSTAIYAITAIIGAQIGDDTLYQDSIQRMNQFVVQDATSSLYGGYGDPATGQAYSFDNLMALLAYVYLNNN